MVKRYKMATRKWPDGTWGMLTGEALEQAQHVAEEEGVFVALEDHEQALAIANESEGAIRDALAEEQERATSLEVSLATAKIEAKSAQEASIRDARSCGKLTVERDDANERAERAVKKLDIARLVAATERTRADSFEEQWREIWRIIEDAPGPNSWTEFRPDKYVLAIRLMSGYRAEAERLKVELEGKRLWHEHGDPDARIAVLEAEIAAANDRAERAAEVLEAESRGCSDNYCCIQMPPHDVGTNGGCTCPRDRDKERFVRGMLRRIPLALAILRGEEGGS